MTLFFGFDFFVFLCVTFQITTTQAGEEGSILNSTLQLQAVDDFSWLMILNLSPNGGFLRIFFYGFFVQTAL